MTVTSSPASSLSSPTPTARDSIAHLKWVAAGSDAKFTIVFARLLPLWYNAPRCA
jgi:hypothetical protein